VAFKTYFLTLYYNIMCSINIVCSIKSMLNTISLKIGLNTKYDIFLLYKILFWCKYFWISQSYNIYIHISLDVNIYYIYKWNILLCSNMQGMLCSVNDHNLRTLALFSCCLVALGGSCHDNLQFRWAGQKNKGAKCGCTLGFQNDPMVLEWPSDPIFYINQNLYILRSHESTVIVNWSIIVHPWFLVVSINLELFCHLLNQIHMKDKTNRYVIHTYC